MHIRRLTPDDAGLFQAFRLEALKNAPTAFGSSYEEEVEFPASVIEGRLAVKPDRGPFGAFHGDELIGLVALGRENLKKLSHKALVWGMYVKPEHRGGGVARSLLLELLSFARSVPGISQVNLCVNAENSGAVRLYESVGFKVFGTEPHAMQIEGIFYGELHMSLQFENA
ncbi:MAG: GNAT family N-acetyltransferase [Microcystis sp. M015S1]|jgi:ribosomal protein S18 acetylase RimI-like enzyme|uniref:GNAT family N-acetyltransferase n=1 Tax=Microcystis sp. M017S1 TaxID=2771107 RepID=UPI002582E7E6|nr:GNAT family N-acetyltransferase [Microcystis sp. M017S1]MCA2933987.1 GNAT family N-acetyltransferase [Microcystis sp. M015S1]MCA3158148.1 GNAT family N-acetyltransferase [Burkholderiales bacterium]MCA2918585.1 GNAT family N-acetyltransferase [Microcystis sp. M017S1]MCA3161763.1 GNAT family N-acetyltransferase [Burkholderiales bacterium]MCA3171429.1 GNAT family N-acetyltransferase [Burkholderiales bacterium]